MDPHYAAPTNEEIHLEDIRGRRVIGSHGTTLGTIEDAAIDPRTWKVSGFVVNLDRELAERYQLPGAQKRGFLETRPQGHQVILGAERVQTFGENVILNVDADQIASQLRAAYPMDDVAPRDERVL